MCLGHKVTTLFWLCVLQIPLSYSGLYGSCLGHQTKACEVSLLDFLIVPLLLLLLFTFLKNKETTVLLDLPATVITSLFGQLQTASSLTCVS